MNQKKLVTAVLTATFTAGIFFPAFAEEIAPIVTDVNQQAATKIMEESQENRLITTLGTVKKIIQEDKYNSLLVDTGETEIEFYVDDNTWFVGENGVPVSLTEWNGKKVTVVHSEAMTMSIPAKSYAKAVFAGEKMDMNYAVVEAVEKNVDGSIILTTDQGSRLVTVGKDAKISPFKTKNRVILEDIKKGSEVILYYEIMALSYPAQAYTDRVILLQSPEEMVSEVQNEKQMVSVRDVAEELGMEIHWRGDIQQVILTKEAFSATVTIGNDRYGINKMSIKLDQVPELRDGRTYIPQSFVEELKRVLQ